jgi:Tol biopolymer transport system component
MAFSPGDMLGPYEILGPIGSGGMGAVYRARDSRMGRDVAIKVSSERFSDRFSTEVHAVAALNHPNICTLHDVGPNYLVMELVEGPTLGERMREGALPLDEALAIARQIADALESAHEKGIVHRDLKPDNIKIKPGGVVKVLDFGLAKATASPALGSVDDSPTFTAGNTEVGAILGTAAYMAPEQAKGRPADRRADVWAFGVVLYEMVTGHRLFPGDTTTEILAAVLKEEPQWHRVPPQVQRLLRRCLEKDPERRLRHIGDAMDLVDPVAPAVASGADGGGRRRWLWAGAAVALLAIGAGAAAWWRAPSRTPTPDEAPTRFQVPLPGNQTGTLTISPDGRRLAYYGLTTDSGTSLLVRDMGDTEWRPLAEVESIGSGTNAVWSPDSRFIAFPAAGALKKVAAAGGPPETICSLQGQFLGGAWNRDGMIVFGTPQGLMQVAAAGGTAQPLTAVDPSRKETAHVGPSFLPDDRHFLYRRNANPPESGGLYVGSLDLGPAEQSSHAIANLPPSVYVRSSASDSDGGHLLFLRQGMLEAQAFDPAKREIAGEPIRIAEQVGQFAVSQAGTLAYRTPGAGRDLQLTWYDRQGKVLSTVGRPAPFQFLTLSPDAKRAAVYMNDQGNTDIWLIDLETGARTRFTFDPAQENNPAWSPDGAYVAFTRASGVNRIFRKAANLAGAEEELLTFDGGRPDVGNISRDGRFLTFSPLDARGQDLWVLPLTGARKPLSFLATPFAEVGGRFSPDGRWIVYISNVSGRNEIWVRPFDPASPAESSPSGGQWMVSQGAIGMPRWRSDGRELFYLAADGTIVAVDVTTEPTFTSGPPRPLFQLSRVFLSASAVGTPGTLADVTADGKRFLIAMPVAESAPEQFTVVLNWPAWLKR